MKTEITQTGETATDVMFGLLWVSVLMWACIAVVVGKRMNERKRMRVGLEIELAKRHRMDGVDRYMSLSQWLEKHDYRMKPVLKWYRPRCMTGRIKSGFGLLSMR